MGRGEMARNGNAWGADAMPEMRYCGSAFRRYARAVAALRKPIASMWPPAPNCYSLIASRRVFAGLNDGTFDAETATGSPVRGLRP